MSRTLRVVLCVALVVGVGIALPRVLAHNVHLTTGETGIVSLQYRGQEYIAQGRFQVNAVEFKTADGHVVAGSTIAKITGSAKGNGVLHTFPWGTVKVNYAAEGNRLKLEMEVANNTDNTLSGIFLDALSLHFPTRLREYDNVTPILAANYGDVTTIRVNYGSSSLVVCDDDVVKPLLIGFPFASDRPASTIFPLRILTSRDKTLPDSLPYVDRPIPPHGRDTYRVSLRFGNSFDSTRAMSDDVYKSFTQAHPFTLDWPDRRPIGSLILATSHAGWRTNPRGYLLEKTMDVTTSAGRTNFQEQVLGWADRSIRVLLDMRAQGMITWDIEGEEFTHPTTYIGDPRVLDQLAPEMAPVADAYFKKFREAGLRVGILVRPQKLVLENGGKSVRQEDGGDVARRLIDKITYARNRWGATLFYIDSNGDTSAPYPVSVFEQIAKEVPNVLLIPEHKTPAYFASTAPYYELRSDIAGTPGRVLELVPDAFSIINIADGQVDAKHKQLQESTKRGDILLFRGWYDDPLNAKVRDLVPAAQE